MCIIVFKPAGINFPSEKMLRTCFENNPDGAGFMFPWKNKVHIRKGFMKYADLLKGLTDTSREYDLVSSDFVMHFRFATQGAVNPGNCHPFPVSTRIADMRAIKLDTTLGMVHNGVIDFCGDKSKKKPILSDTQLFVLDYLAKIPERQLFNHAVQSLVLEATSSKFVIMSPYQTDLIGNFLKDDGIYYSNETYQYTTWRYCNQFDVCDYCGNYDQGAIAYGQWCCIECLFEFGIMEDEGQKGSRKGRTLPSEEVI